MILKDNHKRAGIAILLFLYLIAVLIIFRNDLKLLFLPDPVKGTVYTLSFNKALLNEDTENIIKYEGFIVVDRGLLLTQGSSGKAIFSFKKKPEQGALMRIWFYGDRGVQRPNAIKISVDGGQTYQGVAESGNYIGTVFDLTPYVKKSNNFQILFEAQNHTQLTSKVFDKIEMVIPEEEQAQPTLPNLTMIVGFLFLALIIYCYGYRATVTRTEMSVLLLLLLIIVLAAYLRWNELTRIAGTVLDADVIAYNKYAKKMRLFSDNGFYSAQFSQREPLYILLVKLFLFLFGVAETHVRFISFSFSLVVVYLTYKIGREWFNNVTAIIAAFILSIHPYLISLSARGFRAEWFTTLVLLFVYYGCVKDAISRRRRIVVISLLIGCILLTRSESLFMIAGIMIVNPLFTNKWNYKMVLITIILGFSLLLPHLYSIYKIHGTPFHTVNIYTRFYANREFSGQPGFPTKEELATEGMYTGRKITPAEYYFSLHTPWQLVHYSTVGFVKIHLTMPLYFALGKGNLKSIEYELGMLKSNPNLRQLVVSAKQVISIIQKDWLDYTLASLLLGFFVLGVFLIAFSPNRILLVYMFLFQVQTSFIAYLGIDSRLTVHSYPFMALCCGYSIGWFFTVLWRYLMKPEKELCLIKNT